MVSANTAIVVHSKDCNRFLLDEFFENFKQLEENYPVLLTTEHLSYDRPNVYNLKTGDGLWSERLLYALNTMDYLSCPLGRVDNILFFLEDMIVKSVDLDFVKAVEEYHIKNSIDATKFGVHPFFNVTASGVFINGRPMWFQNNQPYRISHQPVCLFKKEFLEQTLLEPVSPWDHEFKINDKLSNGDFGARTIICVGNPLVKSYQPGTMFGEGIEYHHVLSKGERIPHG